VRRCLFFFSFLFFFLLSAALAVALFDLRYREKKQGQKSSRLFRMTCNMKIHVVKQQIRENLSANDKAF